jgi:HD-GYP domain-containing protein (c-di-GMP phosphodiesterase class II)
MKLFPVNNLESNYYFTKRAYLDEKYILLSPETPITTQMINRLKRWGYKGVLSNGTLVDTPTISNMPSAETSSLSLDQDIKEQELLQEAQTFYAELIAFIERMFTTYVTKSDLQERPISDMVKRTIDMVRSHRGQILRLREMTENEKNYIVNHSAKTTILAISTGLAVRMPPHKLIELGSAALLHEIGMIRLPPQIYMSDKKLTDQERKAITAHPVLGFKILRQFSFPMSISLAVLECRENVDGSGYPRALTGDKISLYAKIISVAAAFAAMTSARPYRGSMDGHAALMEMLKRKGRTYDDTMLRALIVDISIYPIGSYVQLANGQKGLVVESNRNNARTPRVRVIAGPKGEIYAEQQVVDTGSNADVAIARSLPREEFQETTQTAV